MPIWKEHGWHTHAGVTVVVSVKKQAQNTPYHLVLTKSGSTPVEIVRLDLNQNKRVLQSETSSPEEKVTSRLYQLYNWEHRDIQITLVNSVG